ncbi:hypothetical protein GQ457_10G003260 [Hibiscus cannabinus]
MGSARLELANIFFRAYPGSSSARFVITLIRNRSTSNGGFGRGVGVNPAFSCPFSLRHPEIYRVVTVGRSYCSYCITFTIKMLR